MIMLHCDFCSRIIRVGESFHKLSLYRSTDAGYTKLNDDDIEDDATVICNDCYDRLDKEVFDGNQN